MNEEQPIVLVLPRFTPWMKRISILVGASWLLLVLLLGVAPRVAALIFGYGAFEGAAVVPGLQLWRVVTHTVLEDPRRFGVIWTVLSLWLIGSPVEKMQGARRVLELFIAGTIGAVLFALAAGLILPALRHEPVVGLAGFSSALLIALGYLFSDQPVSFFGSGPIKGKHLTLALVAITVLMALVSRSATGAASVGGLAGGAAWMWWVSRAGSHQRGSGGGKGRARKDSGARFRVVQGGRRDSDDRRYLN